MEWQPIKTAQMAMDKPVLIWVPDEGGICIGFYEPITDEEGTVGVWFLQSGASCIRLIGCRFRRHRVMHSLGNVGRKNQNGLWRC